MSILKSMRVSARIRTLFDRTREREAARREQLRRDQAWHGDE